MRELSKEELVSVNGGNLVALAAVSLAGAYYGGREFGQNVYQSITNSFGMSPGAAAFYTFNNK